MTSNTTAQGRALRDPVDILEHLLRLSQHHFGRIPRVLTTDRRGRFEAGWRSDVSGMTAVGCTNMPLAEKQRNHVHLAALITEYADHPYATAELLQRDAMFPASVALLLTPGPRPAQMGPR